MSGQGSRRSHWTGYAQPELGGPAKLKVAPDAFFL
jgi:hypothetical protein